MGVSVVEYFQFGGVNSRANAIGFPANRSLRCKNWVKEISGCLRLRDGSKAVTMSTVSTASPIHSAFYYEKYNGAKHVLFGQGSAVKSLQVGSAGTVSAVATLSSSDPIDAFFANNYLFYTNGSTASDFRFYDGTVDRPVGIRVPTTAEVASVSVVESTGATGSWLTTTLSGYQFYQCYYDPTTQHVGNRTAIGSRVPITGTQSCVVMAGYTVPTGSESEWVILAGRTADGGEVPYVLIDNTGSWIEISGTGATATFTMPDVDYMSELPTRNDVPQRMKGISYVMGRGFGVSVDDPHMVLYSEAETDVISGAYVGRPEQSWPANNALLFPSGEGAILTAEVGGQTWVWSRNHLAIYTESGQFTADGRTSPIRDTLYVGGIAGPRAFIKTQHGPYWVNEKKQLVTAGGPAALTVGPSGITQGAPGGPVIVSAEYDRALLSKISDTYLSSIEIAYFRDTTRQIDRLQIKGKDANGDPLIVVHDFNHKSDMSPYGEGLEYEYEGFTPNVYVRNPGSVISLIDAGGTERLWCGDTAGRFHQLEDGLTDAGSTYSADYIGMVNLGITAPQVAGLGWHGDGNLQVSWYDGLDMDITSFGTDRPIETVYTKELRESRYRVGIEKPARFMVIRLQLDSHATGSETMELNDPPHLPLETYGRIWELKPEIGAGTQEGAR